MVALILTAAGGSERMGGVKKEFLPLPGAPDTVISAALKPFAALRTLAAVVITLPETGFSSYAAAVRSIAAALLSPEIPLRIITGGPTRQASVAAALESLADMSDAVSQDAIVLIHDGARPFVTPALVEGVVNAARAYGAAAPGIPVVDTIKEVKRAGGALSGLPKSPPDPARRCPSPSAPSSEVSRTQPRKGIFRPRTPGNGSNTAVPEPETSLGSPAGDSSQPTPLITAHLQRSTLRAIQTPQAFRFADILAAHRAAAGDGFSYTDDTEIYAAYIGEVAYVEGDRSNRKITTPDDLPGAYRGPALPRIGLGQDRHRLVPRRALKIGGLTIDAAFGEAAHSDGDVLLHALIDAILGATASADIGEHFPDTDEKWENADSAVLLQTVWFPLRKAGWNLVNADCLILLEKPKLLPHRDAIRQNLASLLAVDSAVIGVKAKTGEGIGDVGTGAVIEAWVSVLCSR